MVSAGIPERRTSADIVFDALYGQIMSLSVLPGSKLSELEIAERFGVSRQPVREAFTRLGALDLLFIQPQRPTQVQKFSMRAINAARFVRLAVELEVAREACRRWTDERRSVFEENLAEQDAAVVAGNRTAFHALDGEFHRLIAESAGTPFAYDLIAEKKVQIDRICVLSLKEKHEMVALVEDHRAVFRCLCKGDREGLEATMRVHLARIEKTIEAVRAAHPDYFVS